MQRMLNRSESVRPKFVQRLQDAWDKSTPRERAVFISDLRHKSLVFLNDTCETLLRKEPPKAGPAQ